MSTFSDRLLYDKLVEEFNDIYSSIDNEEVIEEGSNLEMTKLYIDMKKKYLKEMKYFLTNMKKKEYDKCKKGIGNMRAIIDEAEYNIKKLDQDDMSICFGSIIALVKIICVTMVPMLESSINAKISDKLSGTSFANNRFGKAVVEFLGPSKLGTVITIVSTVWALVKNITKLYLQMQAEYGNATTDEEKKKCANLYRLQIISSLHDMKSNLDNYIGIIKYKEQVEKSIELKKNSK